MTTPSLPELPEPINKGSTGFGQLYNPLFNEEQMTAYALSALAADRAATAPAPADWWQQQSAAWIAVARALQEHWSSRALDRGIDGAVELIKMLCEEANAYRAAGRPAALTAPPLRETLRHIESADESRVARSQARRDLQEIVTTLLGMQSPNTHESLLREWFYANTSFDMDDWNRRVRDLFERDDFEADIENNPPVGSHMAGPL